MDKLTLKNKRLELWKKLQNQELPKAQRKDLEEQYNQVMKDLAKK